MPFWQNLELMPASVREKVREKKERSPKEYEQSREKFKEGLREAKERAKNSEITAEVMLYIEFNEKELKEKIAQEKPTDVIKGFMSYDAKKWGQMQQAFANAHFDLQVETKNDGKPKISMQIDLPDGNVSEKLELHKALQDALVTRALGKK